MVMLIVIYFGQLYFEYMNLDLWGVSTRYFILQEDMDFRRMLNTTVTGTGIIVLIFN